MDSLSRFLALADDLPHDPYLPFSGGSLGYVSFEGVRALGGFEPAKGFSRYPQCSFGIYENVAVFNHIEDAALVVSCGHDPKAALHGANILKDRLEGAPRWISKARRDDHSDPVRADHRLFPPDREFMDELCSARDWLRSEKLSRIHIARRAAMPARGVDPVADFLAGGPGDGRRAIFSHDGATAILSLGNARQSMIGDRNWSRLLEELVSDAEREQFAGAPLDKAMKFIHENEATPRVFYGGSFGIFRRNVAEWSSINSSATFADGAMAITKGADMAPDVYPPHFAAELLSGFISV